MIKEEQDTYVISRETIALLSSSHPIYQSKIVESDKEILVRQTPIEIIDHNCTLYGSSYEGRAHAIGKLLNTDKKVPIPVIPNKNVYLLPTSSPTKKDCTWLSFYHIQAYREAQKHTSVTFYNENSILVQTSRRSFDEQYKRTGTVIALLQNEPFFPSFMH